MSNELISILVLVVVFLIATTMGINMGVLGVVAAFALGTAATVALLRRIPGAEVVELDAGCCGMAGSFGFEAEHYDLSMQIGELRLFPALRAAPAGTLISATGVSCRQQIGHGVGRQARHPVELVRAALAT